MKISRHADAKLGEREKRICEYRASSNEADRIAGEIYAPPIRFKRAKEFRCSYVYEHRNQFLEEAGHRQAGGRTSSRRYLHSSGPDKGPHGFKKSNPASRARREKKEKQRDGERKRVPGRRFDGMISCRARARRKRIDASFSIHTPFLSLVSRVTLTLNCAFVLSRGILVNY